ncbi:MAG: PIN domain-containing protein [Verrucomicrobiota bacterium]|nr:PIN domain-containing protein [Verrucomicrobiota bacterium]
MTRWLLDTGPLVAYLDRTDPFHERCAGVIDDFRGHLLTTSAVVVEAMHLLAETRGGPGAIVDFLARSETEIRANCTSLAILQKAATLMHKYRDLPMDFADATLVLLAQETRLLRVLTLDRRGFATFRVAGKRFELVVD